MKKPLKALSLFVCACMLFLALVGCASDDTQPASNGGTIAPAAFDPNYFYQANPVEARLEDEFTDGVYNYYYYYIGYLENFPLLFSTAKRYVAGSVNVTFSETVTAESQTVLEETVRNSVTEVEATNVSFERGMELSVGIDGVIGAKGHVNIGTDWTRETARSSEMSHSVATSRAETLQKGYSIEFSTNNQEGHYRYVQYAKRCDIFVLVVYDRSAGTFSWKYLPYTQESPQNLVEMIEYSEDGNFLSEQKTSLTFDPSIIETIDLSKELDNKAPSLPVPIVPIKLPVNKHLCATDSGYDLDTSGNENDKVNDHSKYEMGHITLYGCSSQGGKYKIGDASKFKLEYVFEQNPADLPSVNGGDLKISDDDATTVKGTPIVNTKIGNGAYCIRVTYKDGSSASPIIQTDFMKDKSEVSVIDMLAGANVDIENISKLEITVVYELYYWANIFDHHHTNWRSDYVLLFE